MNQPRKAVLGLMAGVLVAAAALSPVARGDNPAPAPAAAQPAKIGVVDLRKAYLALAETKASNDQLKGIDGELHTATDAHQLTLKDMQNQLSHLKGQPHEDLINQFDQKSLQFKMDESAMQARMVRQQGRQMAHAFVQIQAAVEALAKKKGLDVVLVSSANDLPENVGDISNQETLQNLIFNRNMLYVSPNVDITAEVIAAVDLAAKTPATPAPAAGH